jgi:hypothetical protein
MGVHLHLIEHRLLGSVASRVAARLEAEFWYARYHPDLLDEQIVIIREELRPMLVDPAETTSLSEPAFL